jgi:hypothetical protein
VLDIGEDTFDAAMFRRLCDQERGLPNHLLIERCRLLDDALGLWRGEPFADVADELLVADTIADLCLRRDDAIARRHEIRLELGSVDGLLPEAQVAHAFLNRTHDPIQATEWFRRADELADTIGSTWTSGICRSELSHLLAIHGDSRAAIQLGPTQIRAFRRAGDLGRLRGTIRMWIPALHKLTDESLLAEIIVIDAGTADRPHVREPHIDQTVAAVLEAIANTISPQPSETPSHEAKRWTTAPCSNKQSK